MGGREREKGEDKKVVISDDKGGKWMYCMYWAGTRVTVSRRDAGGGGH
jgi:hypothetical protein